MYLRLAFAVAAHLEPEILLVDEVLAVGDASFQSKCLGKMGDIANEGRTVLFVSHNMPAVRTLCRRAILLDQGGVEREGDAAMVVQYYLLGEYQESRRVWKPAERPGNNAFKVNSIRLLNSEGADIPAINISEDVIVEIDYEVVEQGATVGFALNLFNSDGVELFATLSNTEQRYYGCPMHRGRYKTRCRLYGNLMNAGRFYFSFVGFSANWSDPFRVDQVIAFDAIDDGLLRGDYYSGFGGSLRPKFLWETVPFESL
jgi:lipopolysaccharide transport system ATP-binding protein